MRLRILWLAAALIASLAGGCSKGKSSDSGPPSIVNLGDVELTYGKASRHDLGGGTTCVLRADPLGPGNVELVSTLEKSGKEVASSRAAPVTAGQPLEISFGSTRVTVTPHIKE
jgi:hypothetical protein